MNQTQAVSLPSFIHPLRSEAPAQRPARFRRPRGGQTGLNWRVQRVQYECSSLIRTGTTRGGGSGLRPLGCEIPSQTLGQPPCHVTRSRRRRLHDRALVFPPATGTGHRVVCRPVVLPGGLRYEVQRHLSCPLWPLRQPVPDPQQAASEMGPIRARPPGRSPCRTGHTGGELLQSSRLA